MEPHVHCHSCGRELGIGERACPRCNATVPPKPPAFPKREGPPVADPRATRPNPRQPHTDPRRTHGG